jgi:hypothetical protein
MSFQLIYSPRARRNLAGIPPGLLDCVEANFRRLADNPQAVSRPAGFPYPPHGMVFVFPCQDGSANFVISVHFLYGQDEQSLEITGFGWYQVA